MPTNLTRRVDRLENQTGARGRMLHVIDVSALPQDYDPDCALAELGVEVKPEDLVVMLVDPTGCEPPPDGNPKHVNSKAF